MKIKHLRDVSPVAASAGSVSKKEGVQVQQGDVPMGRENDTTGRWVANQQGVSWVDAEGKKTRVCDAVKLAWGRADSGDLTSVRIKFILGDGDAKSITVDMATLAEYPSRTLARMEKKGFHAPDRKRAMQFLEYRRQRLIERGDNASERPPTDTDERESSVRAALEQESSATVRSSRESQQGLEREGVLDAFSMVFERQHEGRSHKAVGEHSGQVTRKSVQSVETGGSGTESTSVEGGSNKQVTPTPCLTQGDLVNTTYQ